MPTAQHTHCYCASLHAEILTKNPTEEAGGQEPLVDNHCADPQPTHGARIASILTKNPTEGAGGQEPRVDKGTGCALHLTSNSVVSRACVFQCTFPSLRILTHVTVLMKNPHTN